MLKKVKRPRAFVLVLTSALVLVMTLLLSVLLMISQTDNRRNAIYNIELKQKTDIVNLRCERLDFLNSTPVEYTENIDITVDNSSANDSFILKFISASTSECVYSFSTSSNLFLLETYVQCALNSSESNLSNFTIINSTWGQK